MPLTGQIHFAASVLAIGVGAVVVLLRPKGGRLHRRLGLVYVGAMLTLNVTALMIYRLFGGFGPFHAAALISLVGIALGWRSIFQARAKARQGDRATRALYIEAHYYWMTWSYVGLMAAFASEAITRLPQFHILLGGGRMFGVAVGVATAVVVGTGAVLIQLKKSAAMAPFRPAPSRTASESSAASSSAGT